ncbi:carbamoyltransferase HypF [Mesorhizobium tianshanense]|uniref:Carbamoyltransferase HypF n=1 Tax=Mesorhizobium tianshanense TaxID=39844 RepID=A0A562MM50_9HYPH|nr:carbamoyltransferase HypF [Mesorhizobium tianshanense]TWI20995.1 hydrogenase maturation protein HypF [Mesorhizobium tianshanense]GLS35226.1 carbamoyltransferase HypF [Mesorhizobium tianshanense]
MGALLAEPAVEGRLVRVTGLVQGVGFRPTVWRIATAMGLSGHVRNDAAGVEIALWCSDAEFETFADRLKAQCPPLARIDGIEAATLEGPRPVGGFAIAASAGGQVKTGIVPDAACCPECLAEVLDPKDRRYFYPFANCTHCGPRLSIIKAIPYDRRSTAMARFSICEECRAEYENPADRRYHAQPIACPACGPRVWLEGPDHVVVGGGPQTVIREAAALIGEGRIVAIKGIGGFHLACDATDEAAVAQLRARKKRDGKPFALMARDLEQLAEFAELSGDERAALAASAAPIVLVKRRDSCGVAAGVAPEHEWLGFMLPYTPLHHLLLRALDAPVVMTSGNRSGEPQCTDNDEARQELAGIADFWLMHDREIVNRLDDSVVRRDGHGISVLRRARGFAPEPLALPAGFDGPVRALAAGGDLKAAFCLAGDGKALLSQHLGDLDDLKNQDAWGQALELYRSLFDTKPDLIVADRHPGYRSTRLAMELARETAARFVQVQHHHAHLASCLAQHGRAIDAPPVLGIILDGLGYGDDGTIWGGEFLLGGYRGFRRLAYFEPVALPGGDKASVEPWRNAYAYLRAAFGPDFLAKLPADRPFIRALAEKPLGVLDRMIERGVNAPLASSAGRLFDACAAVLGICFERQSYEGQAGMEMEALASPFMDAAEAWPATSPKEPVISWKGLWEALLRDQASGVETGLIAARFHRTLIEIISRKAIGLTKENGVGTVALSGGAFQNRLLLEGVLAELTVAGLEGLAHASVPANDGGLALGQATIGLALSH